MSNSKRNSKEQVATESSDTSSDEKVLNSKPNQASNTIKMDELDELFDPSLKYVAIFKCYYWDSNDLVRKGKIFLTKDELFFKCSSMPFVKAHFMIADIQSVSKLNNYKNGIDQVLFIKLDDKKSYAFYKFHLPKTLIKNTIETLMKDHDEMYRKKEEIARHSSLFVIKRLSKIRNGSKKMGDETNQHEMSDPDQAKSEASEKEENDNPKITSSVTYEDYEADQAQVKEARTVYRSDHNTVWRNKGILKQTESESAISSASSKSSDQLNRFEKSQSLNETMPVESEPKQTKTRPLSQQVVSVANLDNRKEEASKNEKVKLAYASILKSPARKETIEPVESDEKEINRNQHHNHNRNRNHDQHNHHRQYHNRSHHDKHHNHNHDRHHHGQNRVSFVGISQDEPNQSCIQKSHMQEPVYVKFNNYFILISPILLVFSFLMVFINMSKLYDVEKHLIAFSVRN